jgi:hypothetical protein
MLPCPVTCSQKNSLNSWFTWLIFLLF